MYGFFMQINSKSLIIAICITIFFIILYYFSFVFTEKYLQEFCNSNYCIDFLPFGDFLTILIAIISLYFVFISLNSWKIQLSHQSTQNLYFEFLKLEYDLLKLQGEFYKLKQDGNPQKQHADYIEYIKDKNFSNRFEELDLKISSQKTRYSIDIKEIYFDAAGTFDQLHVKFLLLFWNESDTVIDREDINKLSENARQRFKKLMKNLRILKQKLDADTE